MHIHEPPPQQASSSSCYQFHFNALAIFKPCTCTFCVLKPIHGRTLCQHYHKLMFSRLLLDWSPIKWRWCPPNHHQRFKVRSDKSLFLIHCFGLHWNQLDWCGVAGVTGGCWLLAIAADGRWKVSGRECNQGDLVFILRLIIKYMYRSLCRKCIKMCMYQCESLIWDQLCCDIHHRLTGHADTASGRSVVRLRESRSERSVMIE